MVLNGDRRGSKEQTSPNAFFPSRWLVQSRGPKDERVCGGEDNEAWELRQKEKECVVKWW